MSVAMSAAAAMPPALGAERQFFSSASSASNAASSSASDRFCPEPEEFHKVTSKAKMAVPVADAKKMCRGKSSGNPRENPVPANVVMQALRSWLPISPMQRLLLPMLVGFACVCCALPLWWACPPGGCVSRVSENGIQRRIQNTMSHSWSGWKTSLVWLKKSEWLEDFIGVAGKLDLEDFIVEVDPVLSDKSITEVAQESTESSEVSIEELPNTSVPLYQTLVGPPSKTDQAWETVPFPVIALLMLAGYALIILAIMYLPACLGPEASMWAMLTVFALLLTWKWWLNLLLELVLFAYRWPLNCSAVFAVACLVLYPIVRIMNDDYQRNLLYGLTKAYFGYGDNETRFLGEQGRSASAEVGQVAVRRLARLPLGDSSGSVPAGCETFHASASWLPVASSVTKAVARPDTTTVPRVWGEMPVGQDTSPATSVGKTLQCNPSELPVSLHVYDVSNDGRVETFNSLLAPRVSPLKLGGIFHVGVEVNGQEWSFGQSLFGSGVCGLKPRAHPSHNFRDTMELRPTQLSEQQVVRVLEMMSSEYQGSDYDLLRRNCIHFADDLCSRLGVGVVPRWVHRFPRWVHRFARTAERLYDGLLRIAQIFEEAEFTRS